MKVLALDTATEACSVALLMDGALVSRFKEVGRGHAEQILGMVDAVLGEAGVALGMLDGIAAGVGPGAFTGVRISVSVAQGLAFGAGLPVVGVTTLEALALQALRGGADGERTLNGGAEPGVGAFAQAMACLDARMGEVYWGCFSADAACGVIARGPMAVSAAPSVRVPLAGPFAGIGRGFAAYPSLRELPGVRLLPGACDALPHARDMARLGAIRLAAGEGVDPAGLAPVYVRDKVALTEAERAAAKAALG
ncbi:MAG: tRNA (adenosine(37)-N6)-threonylcarbamoyltransferase complex dimerization subunit type 1 TsaB [Pseudomonadota bacterium]|nr:tRNA (adenosine(37)-N6)-threonylcarbamoyltransferase complex dimerization subunit type 1 TsaB [Pseudomonadota bacterium]